MVAESTAKKTWDILTKPSDKIRKLDERRSARLLSSFLLTLMLLGSASGIIQLIMIPGFFNSFLGIMIGVSVLTVAYGISRTRQYKLAAILAALVPTMVTLRIMVTNPEDSLAAPFMLVGILIASMFFSIHSIAILVAINGVGLLLLPLIAPTQLTYPDILGPLFFVLISSALVIMAYQHRTRIEEDRQKELKEAYEATLEGWARALELRDSETQGHSQRVTEMLIRLARQVGINDQQLEYYRWGALLHDIGKISIPDEILNKPGKLSDEEMEIVKKHPEIAYRMLAPINFLHPALDIPRYHHEKWDGSGYPYGLGGEEIPVAARLFSIVDVWDAMQSNRPYRKAMTREQTLKYLIEQSGKHFDPTCVEIFFEVINR